MKYGGYISAEAERQAVERAIARASLAGDPVRYNVARVWWLRIHAKVEAQRFFRRRARLAKKRKETL